MTASRLNESTVSASTAIRSMELACKMSKSTVRRFAEATPPRLEITKLEMTGILQDAVDIVRQATVRQGLTQVMSSGTPPSQATSSDAPSRTAFVLSFLGMNKQQQKEPEPTEHRETKIYVGSKMTPEMKLEMQYSEYA